MDIYLSVWDKIKSIVRDIKNSELKNIVLDIIENPYITFTDVRPKINLLESPAAPKKHHAYPGGLVEHTLSVTMLSINIAEVYREVYGASIDVDLVVATAILHDLFKYYQYEYDELIEGFRARSDWYIPHDYAMAIELAKRGAPDKLIRCIIETHGNAPHTMIESLIVHSADSIDANIVSKLQDIIWGACGDLEAKLNIPAIRIFNRALRRSRIIKLMEVYYSSGRSGLREYIKKIISD